MAEIPLHLPTPSVPGWVRGVFEGRIAQRTKGARQSLGDARTTVVGLTPIFSFRRGYSSRVEHQLEKRSEDYNVAKNALDPTDRAAHTRVMEVYEELREMYAYPPRFTVTLFGRSHAVFAFEKPAVESVDANYISPFLPRTSASPDPSPALGD